ncbi:3-hydroxyacyl-CoA dehydrogenase [Jimgerdemannia flammicorona]|uniref:3-hydroxyacyl-CoA dehydrogenase n=2 Tax=Jimgerdemannia flammicorona TaxID=994334 RepID=A0A433DMF1_9FUNG|nr:3-hydroxyacyl-CoA dehydrogenase [Jimgerdemannia flammicorona]RUS25366.1 3-hydroxyacyl-CoA dehydrogenase [Jimgerdemannia flammicorona]
MSLLACRLASRLSVLRLNIHTSRVAFSTDADAKVSSIANVATCSTTLTFLTPSSSCCLQHSFKRIGVIGAGQMGLGIALVTANVAKLRVVIMDASSEQLDKGIRFMGRPSEYTHNALAPIDKLLEKDVSKNRLTSDDAAATRSRVTTATSLEAFADVDFVIEAVSENEQLKRNIFSQLDKIAMPETVLATNTSSISITKIAAATTRPEKVIGMHFMNPVPVMQLVEIIPGLATFPSVLAETKALATAMGKICTTSQDVPGFVANRLLMPYINEAIMTLESVSTATQQPSFFPPFVCPSTVLKHFVLPDQGIATREDIDTTMKLGTNVPMGPLTLADFIGLDTCLAIMKVMHNGTGDSKYRPSVLLQKHVDAGWVGKKSGRGFYEY